MQKLAASAAREYGIPPAIVLAVMEQESSFLPNAYRAEPGYYDKYIGTKPTRWNKSPIFGDRTLWGSYGLMQVLASTAYGMGYPVDLDPRTGGVSGGKRWPSLYNPTWSANLGTRYLKQRLLKYWTSKEGFARALSAYNSGGPDTTRGRQYAAQVLKRAARYLNKGIV